MKLTENTLQFSLVSHKILQLFEPGIVLEPNFAPHRQEFEEFPVLNDESEIAEKKSPPSFLKNYCSKFQLKIND